MLVMVIGAAISTLILQGVESQSRIKQQRQEELEVETDSDVENNYSEQSFELPSAVHYRDNACIVQSSKKVHRQLRNITANDQIINENVYFADDGCALGHLVKDAGIVTSYVNLGFPVQKVVFSHPCADPENGSELFKNIILEWYKVLNNVSLVFTKTLPKRKCFKKVYTRPGWRWFHQPRHGSIFRKLFWSHFGISTSDSQQINNVIEITLLKRTSNRKFSEDQVASVIRNFCDKVNFCNVRVVIMERHSYQRQLEILFKTDLLIAAHGAGLSNIVVMRPHTALIEMFPYNFKYLMFEELARLMSLFYFSYESLHRTSCCPHLRTQTNISSFPQFMRHVNGAKSCKNCDITIPEYDLMNLLRSSFQSVLLSRHRLVNVLNVDRRS